MKVVLEYFLHELNKFNNKATSWLSERMYVEHKKNLNILCDFKDFFVDESVYIFDHISITIINARNVHPNTILRLINILNKFRNKCLRFVAWMTNFESFSVIFSINYSLNFRFGSASITTYLKFCFIILHFEIGLVV